MIAVTFALPAESSDFRRKLEGSHRAGRAIAGALQGREVVVFHTGVGEDAARKAVVAFLDEHSPRVLVSAGFAGALVDTLRVGELLVAENFSHQSLTAAAHDALSSEAITIGNLVTAAQIADDAMERASLAQSSGAVAVDMETKFIAAACADKGIAMLSLRAITDTPASPFGLPAEVLFDLARQRTDLARLVFHIGKHPAAIGKLISISQRVQKARAALARGLDLLFRSDALDLIR